ncbi:hypothetical protein TNCV_703861 [Trichonephila clavipes]|nr:hypothetical protein TNCV_703861 [Trichonephila clavipes]
MTAVHFLHQGNPPTWARVEPAILCTEGQRQTNYVTQPNIRANFKSVVENEALLKISKRDIIEFWLVPPPAKSSAPCACSESWVYFRENFTKQKRNALSSFATVMSMRKRGSLGRKTGNSKAVEHTRAAEAPDEKRARLQADQAHHSLVRAAETPEQYQVRLQLLQVRQNASRAAESPEQGQSRLHEDQVHHRVA